MNVRALVTCLPLWLVIGLTAAGAAEPAKAAGKKITVTGSATVALKPDAARLVFGVTTTMPDLKGVRAENEKHVKKMLEGISGLGFKDVDIQAVPGSVNSVQTNDGGAAAGPAFSKQVQTVITVTLREKDLEKLRRMVVKLSDTATENGGSAVTSDEFAQFGVRLGGRMGRGFVEATQGPQIEWVTHDVAEARREAIKKAMSDAHANALAALPDAKLEIAEVTVSSGETLARQRARLSPYAMVMDTTVTSVTVEVQVTFSY